MDNAAITRLQTAVATVERQEKEAVELLRHLQEEGDQLLAVIERQQATVKALQGAAEAGRTVLAGAVRLGGIEALAGATKLQASTAAVGVAELDAAVAAVPASTPLAADLLAAPVEGDQVPAAELAPLEQASPVLADQEVTDAAP